MFKRKLRTPHFDPLSVSTEAAKEILSIPSRGECNEWRYLPTSTKKETHHQVVAQNCGCILVDKNGVSRPGLWFDASFRVGRKVVVSRLTLTIFQQESKEHNKQRVIQLEAVHPVTKGLMKSGPSSDHWPHLHLGQERTTLPLEQCKKPFSEHLTFFCEKANLTLDPAPDLTIDASEFELR